MFKGKTGAEWCSSNCTFMELKSGTRSSLNSTPFVLIVPLWNWNKDNVKVSVSGNYRSNCTFMELKSRHTADHLLTRRVLIVPLWNWNVYTHPFFLQMSRSNCTFMELKWNMIRTKKKISSSNCTFMELKYLWRLQRLAPSTCSNCTFMELKFGFKLVIYTRVNVLIVPLWNWNFCRIVGRIGNESSNCTFMELKFQ